MKGKQGPCPPDGQRGDGYEERNKKGHSLMHVCFKALQWLKAS